MGWRTKLNDKVKHRARDFILEACDKANKAVDSEKLWEGYQVWSKDHEWYLPKSFFITLRCTMSRELKEKYDHTTQKKQSEVTKCQI